MGGPLQGKRPQSVNTSAQSADIQDALESAGLWKKTGEVGDLLSKAGVPENAKVFITIRVDKNLNVKIMVEMKPSDKSKNTLEGQLNQKYAAKMKAALQKAKLDVADTIELKWMNF